MPVQPHEYVSIYQQALANLAKEKGLTGEMFRIAAHMLSKVEFGGNIPIQQVDIVDELKIDKARVSKAIKKLVEKGIFEKETKPGRRSAIYRLADKFGKKPNTRQFIV